MRLIGISSVWASEDWVELFLQNSLEYLDELRIAICGYYPEYKRLEDRTEEIVRDFASKDERIKIVEQRTNTNGKIFPDPFRCNLLNRLVKEAKPEPKDVLMICDVDEFYDEVGVGELKSSVNLDFDMGNLQCLYFCVNMDWYTKNMRMPRLYRYVPGFFFVPTQNPRPVPRIEYTFTNFPMYHYSMLLDPEIKRIQWKYAPAHNPVLSKMKIRWLEEVYMNWNLEDDSASKAKNLEVTKSKGFWLTDKGAFQEKPGGGLSPFLGKHPDVIENSSLRQVPDFRFWYRRKK